VFRTRNDVALVRLGHPLITRSMARLRQRVWEPDRHLRRWTITAAPVGTPLLLLPTLVNATNDLRESIHSELIDLALGADGRVVEPTDVPAQRGELPAADLAPWRTWLADRWDELAPAAEQVVRDRTTELDAQLDALLGQHHAAEQGRQQELYDHRLKELAKEPTDRAIERLRKELLKAEQQASRLTFFVEENEARRLEVARLEHRLEQVEFERVNAHRERLRSRIEAERERMLDSILPRRFKLHRLQLTPVAVELVVPEGAHP
jgi:hypothetical protein